MNNTVTSTAKILSISPQAVSSLIKRNRLQAEKNGYRYSVSCENLLSYVNLRLSELRKETKELESVISSISIDNNLTQWYNMLYNK